MIDEKDTLDVQKWTKIILLLAATLAVLNGVEPTILSI